MRSTLIFAVGFIAFTIIGTITHELGHYFAGKSLGLDCSIHYAYCHCVSETEIEGRRLGKELHSTYGKRELIPDELWEEYQNLIEPSSGSNHLWVTIGGPLQTIITGLIGFFLLTLRRINKVTEFVKADWLLVFLSLLWLREPFNLFLSVSKKIFFGRESYFGGDELKISRGLNLWDGTVPIIMGLMGSIICLIMILKYIPVSRRKDFIHGGFIGGISGYIIWMKILGPVILP